MARSQPVQCPVCGWTGEKDDLVREGSDLACPVCQETLADT
ncbi:MAG: hypothetical protein ABEJ27_03285 [Halodesulfurarchaeum sp.]